MSIELACHFPDPTTPWVKIYSLNGKPLFLEKSLTVARRSPTGFSNGFDGSGPAQLALAIYLEHFNQVAAVELYEQFRWEHIATIGHDGENEAQQEPFTVLLDVSKYADLANSNCNN